MKRRNLATIASILLGTTACLAGCRPDRSTPLEETSVETSDGQTVLLSEISEITHSTQPSHRRRRWPPE